MKAGIFLDENMSNLTSASNEAGSLSSSSNRNIEIGTTIMYPPPPPQMLHHQSSSFASVPITTNNNQTHQSNKKKRNLPGNPDPEAEVVALSPKSLMATNRFICEICNKGFQRDQNLQLHRRGHNLPWKLKQKSKLEVVKKKVYVCPEPSCVHHEPSRALGDLTGIKKHFSRKHGEKKWKCDKCSKRYAVQSDWKAHSKICGTREYRCDCGTLFSRRDSFITHRAFCDALAQETHLVRSSNSSSAAAAAADLINHHHHHHHLPLHLPILNFPLKSEPPHLNLQHPPQLSFKVGSSSPVHHQLPSWLDHIHQQQQQQQNEQNLNCSSSHMMSATALLQKAAQMGVTMSNNNSTTAAAAAAAPHIILNNGSHQHDDHMCAPPLLLSHHHGSLSSLSASDDHNNNNNNHHHVNIMLEPNSGFNCMAQQQQQILHQHHPNSNLISTSVGSTNIHDIFNSMLSSTKKDNVFPQAEASKESMLNARSKDGKDDNELTRDFLGLRGFIPNPTTMADDHQHFMNMAAAGLDQHMNHHHHQQQLNNQNQIHPWQG